MQTRAVLFDLDDTLLVDEDLAETAFLATCRLADEKHGIAPEALRQSVRQQARALWRASPTIDYARGVGISSWEGLWAPFLGDDPGIKTLRAWAPAYRRLAWSHALADHDVDDPPLAETLAATFPEERSKLHVVFPETIDVLTDLRRTFPLALVTNGPSELQRHKIQATNLGRFFDEITISGDLGIGKPDPRIFSMTLDRLGAPASAAVMVGNSLERDVGGAQRAGLRGIWVNRSASDPPLDIKPDAQISSLSELRNVID